MDGCECTFIMLLYCVCLLAVDVPLHASIKLPYSKNLLFKNVHLSLLLSKGMFIMNYIFNHTPNYITTYENCVVAWEKHIYICKYIYILRCYVNKKHFYIEKLKISKQHLSQNQLFLAVSQDSSTVFPGHQQICSFLLCWFTSSIYIVGLWLAVVSCLWS